MPAAPPSVELSAAACSEIADVARRTGRSVAFIARRALAAGDGDGKNPASTSVDKAQDKLTRVKLVLTTGEDDPAGLHAKIRAAAGQVPLGEALERAWARSRAKFFAWVAREEAAGAAEQADELDAGLRDAQSPSTGAARLAELAASAYPRVRHLAAQHPSLPADALAKLANDRERVVREAAAEVAARRGKK